MKKVKPQLVKNHVQRKLFSFTLDGTQLQFQLRTDVKVELQTFLKLLEEAQTELNSELDKLI